MTLARDRQQIEPVAGAKKQIAGRLADDRRPGQDGEFTQQDFIVAITLLTLVLVACALKLCVLAARARRRHHAPGGAGARHTAASWAAGVAAQAMTQAGRA